MTGTQDPAAPAASPKGGLGQRLKRFILHPELSPEQVALSFAIGFSLSWNPLVGLHTWLILLLCVIFRKLHQPLMLLACYINNPWTMLPMATFSSLVGNLLLGRGWHLNLHNVQWHAIGWRSFVTRSGFGGMCRNLKPVLVPYLLGGFVMSVLALVVGYYVMLKLARTWRARHAQRLARRHPGPDRPPRPQD